MDDLGCILRRAFPEPQTKENSMPVFARCCLLCLLSLVLLTAPEPVAAAPIPLKMSATQPQTHPNYLALKHLEKLLNEKAPGRFAISVHGGMSLGSDVDVARQVRAGLIQVATNATANLSNLSPVMAVCDLPYLFENVDEALAVLDGPYGQKLLDTLPRAGIVGLAYIPASFRQIFNNKRPVHGPRDIEGLKLRVAQSAMDIATAKVMGAAPTPLAFGDVYSAIEQKVLEGILIPELLGYDMRFHEVAKNLAFVDCQAFILVWFANAKWFNALPEDLKPVFLECVKEARDWQMRETAEGSKLVVEKLEKEGCVITYLSGENKEKLMKAAKLVWEEFDLPKGALDEMLAAKAAVKK